MKPETKKAIGIRLRQLRLECGITQQELAGRLGARPNYISNIETGKALPSVGRLFDIADAMKIPSTLLIDNLSAER